MDLSINSSIGRKASENQKGYSNSIDFHSVSSSCVTSKELKSINHFCSSINNYYKNMKKHNSLALNIFHLNNLKYNILSNTKIKHNFLKTKSYDSILPNISDNISAFQKKKNKNLKLSINNDNNDNNNKNKNKNIFYTPKKSNFSTNANSLNLQNISNISNIKKSLINEHSSYINSNNNNKIRIKNSLSLGNLSINPDYYDNNDYKSKIRRENLNEYLDKTRKIIKFKFAQNDMKKLFHLEKEKIETKIEQYNLDINSLKKLYNLFKKYILSLDSYSFHIKEEIIIGKKENTELIERKKVLHNEIFALGHIIYRIKNKFKDYLNNKYFLLSVKNHTKKLDYFSTKDKKDFNNDLMILQQIDEKINSIFLINSLEEKNEDTRDNNKDEIKKYSISNKEGFKKFLDVKKRFYSQKSIRESMRVKKIYNTPYQFIKDLNLISLGINKYLKIFNKIQYDLLEDKKLLNNLNKSSFENEKLEKEYKDKEANLKIKLNASIAYNKYLKKQIKNLLFHSKKYKIRNDFILIKIEDILDSIKTYGDEKLLKFLEISGGVEMIKNKDYNNDDDDTIKKKNHKLNLLKIIEKAIIFLQKSNKEFKKNGEEKYKEIENKIRYLSHLNNSRKKIENEKNKKKIQLLKILEKSKNIIFLPNKNNYYVNSKLNRKKFSQKNNNIKNENKIIKTMFDIDFDY